MADGLELQSDELATIEAGVKVATDDAGADGHVQIVKLAISTDGSATVIPANATDGLLVEVSNPGDIASASSNVQKSSTTIGGLTTATTLYSAGDQLGTILELTNMATTAGGKGFIGSMTLLCDIINVVGPVRAWIFPETVTLASDNAAFSLSDADAAKCIGTVTFPYPVTATNNSIATVTNVNLDYECTGTSLFVALETLIGHANHFAAADDLTLTARAFRL